MKICVLGAGTWGTALAALLARGEHEVTLWSAIPRELEALKSTGAHPNLPDAQIPDSIIYEKDISVAIPGRELILFVVPSKFIRSTAALVAPYLDNGAILVSAAKGLEEGTLGSMTDLIEDEVRKSRPDISYKVAALSGPTHAEEVARGLVTSIVAACEDEKISMRIAEAFSSSCMRVYTNTDVRGVELAGALKNIVAMAAGILRGMGLGDNALAMLMTRGAAEITRVGVALGCKRRTFMGLAGIGDLIVTCTSRHSRNNRCGELIGRGMTYEDAAKEIGMVVEGYYALGAAMELCGKYNVEMPITEAVYDIIFRGITPKEAMIRLMSRDLKDETAD